MSTFVFINNFSTTLAAALTSTGTTVTLASSTGLPTLASGQIMPLTLNDAATGQIYEILYVTAISGATLTVERAQERTAAQAWAIGDYAKCMPTAQSVEPAGGNPAQTFQVAAATASNQAVNLGQLSEPARTIIFSSNGTWTVPAGITQILVSGCGAGGGGGGGGGTVGSSGFVGGGGGAGGNGGDYVLDSPLTVVSGHSLSIAIGAEGPGGIAGASGGAGGGNGGAGGNTVITDTTTGTVLLTLQGGPGGFGGFGMTSTTAGVPSGGAGGTANTAVGIGGYGSNGSDGNYTGDGGVGASSAFGPAGGGGRASASATHYNGLQGGYGAGGGGGGAAYGATAYPGAAGGYGGGGYLIIKW